LTFPKLKFSALLKRDRFELDMDFKIENKGTGLFGPSGSGKTTILEMIAGIVKPDRGRIILGDRVLFDSELGINLPPHQRRVGIVFQQLSLFPHMSVGDNLLYGYKLVDESRRKFTPGEIITLLDIERHLKKMPSQLSGGEKQRVAIGRAILSSPELLLLDEPLSSLDVNLKSQILPFLRRVFCRMNIPTIIVSHSMDELLYLTDDIIMVADGRSIGRGNIITLLKNKKCQRYLLGFGFDNSLECRILEHDQNNKATIVGFGKQKLLVPIIDREIGEIISVDIRSEDISIGRNPDSDFSICNQLECVVKDIVKTSLGVVVILELEGSELVTELMEASVHKLSLKRGERVYCFIKMINLRPGGRYVCYL